MRFAITPIAVIVDRNPLILRVWVHDHEKWFRAGDGRARVTGWACTRVTYIDPSGKLWIIGLGQIRQFCSPEKYDRLVAELSSSIDDAVEKRSKS